MKLPKRRKCQSSWPIWMIGSLNVINQLLHESARLPILWPSRSQLQDKLRGVCCNSIACACKVTPKGVGRGRIRRWSHMFSGIFLEAFGGFRSWANTLLYISWKKPHPLQQSQVCNFCAWNISKSAESWDVTCDIPHINGVVTNFCWANTSCRDQPSMIPGLHLSWALEDTITVGSS